MENGSLHRFQSLSAACLCDSATMHGSTPLLLLLRLLLANNYWNVFILVNIYVSSSFVPFVLRTTR